ncbi:hypothetical protein, partial [Treponema pedis]
FKFCEACLKSNFMVYMYFIKTARHNNLTVQLHAITCQPHKNRFIKPEYKNIGNYKLPPPMRI